MKKTRSKKHGRKVSIRKRKSYIKKKQKKRRTKKVRNKTKIKRMKAGGLLTKIFGNNDKKIDEDDKNRANTKLKAIFDSRQPKINGKSLNSDYFVTEPVTYELSINVPLEITVKDDDDDEYKLQVKDQKIEIDYKNIFKDIYIAINSLHTQDYTHNNITSESIMLYKNEESKVFNKGKLFGLNLMTKKDEGTKELGKYSYYRKAFTDKVSHDQFEFEGNQEKIFEYLKLSDKFKFLKILYIYTLDDGAPWVIKDNELRSALNNYIWYTNPPANENGDKFYNEKLSELKEFLRITDNEKITFNDNIVDDNDDKIKLMFDIIITNKLYDKIGDFLMKSTNNTQLSTNSKKTTSSL